MILKKELLAFAIPALLLTGCGLNTTASVKDSSIHSNNASNEKAVDNLSQVIICFKEISLKGQTQDITFTVGESGTIPANDLCVDSANNAIPNTVGLDLLDFTGSASIAVIQSINIPDGNYAQLRVALNDGSYAVDALSGEKHAVTVPSNELLLDGFTAAYGGVVDLSLEFDATTAMKPDNKTGYTLNADAVKLVDHSKSSHLAKVTY